MGVLTDRAAKAELNLLDWGVKYIRMRPTPVLTMCRDMYPLSTSDQTLHNLAYKFVSLYVSKGAKANYHLLHSAPATPALSVADSSDESLTAQSCR